MKALFYFPVNVDIYPDSSIAKKNEHIISSTKRLGVEVDTIKFSFKGIHFNNSLLAKIPNNKLMRGMYSNVFAFNILKKLNFKKYDFVWIRTGLCLPPFLGFIKNIKSENKRAKIILEYGSYPIKDDLYGYQKLLFPIDVFLTKYLKKYVSYVITYHEQNEVFGIPNIKIGNGIDTSLIQWNKTEKSNSRINLISVSGLMFWHGYDRVIKGLGEYYRNNSNRNIDVFFHIVGEGPELNILKKIVADYGLEERVIFHGFKVKKELNEIFDQSHLAIGSLGYHRKNYFVESSLKNREYFARGLPFVLAVKDKDFPPGLPFVKYISSDESPVDINSLVEFYQNIIEAYPNYSNLIRKYAEENLTWESKIKQVLEVIRQ